MKLKDISVAKKIALIFSITGVAVIALGIFLMSELQGIRDSFTSMTDETIPSVLTVDQIELDAMSIRRYQYSMLADIHRSDIKEKVANMKTVSDSLVAKLDQYEPTIISEVERQAFNGVRKAWNSIQASQVDLSGFILQGNLEAATKDVRESFDEFTAFQQALNALIEVNKNFVRDDKEQTLAEVQSATYITCFGIGIIVIFMIAMTILLASQIKKPLLEVMKMAGQIAAGDLTYQLQQEHFGEDELGELAESCVHMQSNLRALVEEISAAVVQLGTAIEEVSAISEQSSQGMSAQQNEITMVATAMNQMQMTVNEVARNTEDASSSAAEATKEAGMGNQDIQENIVSIQQVSEVIENAGQLVQQLEEDTTSIGMVVDVIGGIADQTNLLALNAAIEAARAGEQGRGFAVVADEVRTLAGRTQDSTREITEIIEKLQHRANDAGSATKQSCDMIRGCVEQSIGTGEKITAIETAVSQIAEMSTQIASACSEQTSVTEELNRNVANINTSSTEVATGSQQTAQACIELSRLSVGLQTSIGSFKTE